jgi:hypothetical protein
MPPAPALATPPGRRHRCGAVFGWVSPLVSTGYARQLQDADLPPPPPGVAPVECGNALWGAWLEVRARGSGGAGASVTPL